MAGSQGLGRYGRVSTGPKTAEGKARCAKNSTRHGLSTYRGGIAEVRSLADEIGLHFDASQSELGLVHALAEAELRLGYVQAVVLGSLAGTGELKGGLSARLAERYVSEAQAQRRVALDVLVAAQSGGANS